MSTIWFKASDSCYVNLKNVTDVIFHNNDTATIFQTSIMNDLDDNRIIPGAVTVDGPQRVADLRKWLDNRLINPEPNAVDSGQPF